MGYWKKHPKKDLQGLLEWLDGKGWAIKEPPKYYRVTCPCGKHIRWVHLTPSDPNYEKNARKWFERTCDQGRGET